MAGQAARCWGRRTDRFQGIISSHRFQGRPLPQPLLQQQGSCSTVEPTAAIPGKTMTLRSSPGAGVLIHPGQGKLQSPGKTQTVTTTVRRLLCGLPLTVQREAHDKPLHRAAGTVLTNHEKIKLKRLSVKSFQGRNGNPKRVTTSQTDPPPPHIKTENRTAQ